MSVAVRELARAILDASDMHCIYRGDLERLIAEAVKPLVEVAEREMTVDDRHVFCNCKDCLELSRWRQS